MVTSRYVMSGTLMLIAASSQPSRTVTASRVDQNQEKLSRTHPQSRPTLRTAGSLQGVPPSCCGRRVAVWSGACPIQRSTASGTTSKQPANLVVESTEESLSILPDYTATVRPSPKRC
jgi:hypothetical protein